ncbi:hypothetical protein BH23ACT9_BH23ACT9_36660 [soil metagenome]
MTWSDPLVQTVAPGVHRAPVPLPSDGLRAVNIYVIEDGDGVTLIDAGWDGPVAREAVQRGLEVAGAEIGDVHRILVSHVHYDHLGQATALRREGARAYWLGEGEKSTFTNLVTDPQASRQTTVLPLAFAPNGVVPVRRTFECPRDTAVSARLLGSSPPRRRSPSGPPGLLPQRPRTGARSDTLRLRRVDVPDAPGYDACPSRHPV